MRFYDPRTGRFQDDGDHDPYGDAPILDPATGLLTAFGAAPIGPPDFTLPPMDYGDIETDSALPGLQQMPGGMPTREYENGSQYGYPQQPGDVADFHPTFPSRPPAPTPPSWEPSYGTAHTGIGLENRPELSDPTVVASAELPGLPTNEPLAQQDARSRGLATFPPDIPVLSGAVNTIANAGAALTGNGPENQYGMGYKIDASPQGALNALNALPGSGMVSAIPEVITGTSGYAKLGRALLPLVGGEIADTGRAANRALTAGLEAADTRLPGLAAAVRSERGSLGPLDQTDMFGNPVDVPLSQ